MNRTTRCEPVRDASPPVLLPESFGPLRASPFGELSSPRWPATALQSANISAVHLPERLWELAPSAEPATRLSLPQKSRFSGEHCWTVKQFSVDRQFEGT